MGYMSLNETDTHQTFIEVLSTSAYSIHKIG